MRFNIKLIEYNNTATIKIYDDLMGFDNDYKRPPPKEKEAPVIIEPFTNMPVTEFIEEDVIEEDVIEEDVIEEDVIEEFRKKQFSIYKSVQRSKRKIYSIIRSMNLENAFFVTLTFDKKKVDRKDFTLCCRKTRVWLQNIRKINGVENMSFLCVPELHSDKESWHMHLILCDVDELPMTDSGHKDKSGKTIYNLDGWHYGFSTAVRIEADAMSSLKLSKYVTKYITKESTLIAHNKHRYFASQNIPQPEETPWLFTDETEKKSILQLIYKKGYEIISENHYEGYVDIEYFEAIKNNS